MLFLVTVEWCSKNAAMEEVTALLYNIMRSYTKHAELSMDIFK